MQQGGKPGRGMLEGQGQAQPVVNRELWAAVEPIQAGVTRAGDDSTFLGVLGQRHWENPNLEQVGVTHVEFVEHLQQLKLFGLVQSWSSLA